MSHLVLDVQPLFPCCCWCSPQVFMFMGSDRVLSKVPVAVMGKDIQEPTLRIRCDAC